MAYELSCGTAPALQGEQVEFYMTIDGHIQRFLVSRSALVEAFGEESFRTSPVQFFESLLDKILPAAAAKYEASRETITLLGGDLVNNG